MANNIYHNPNYNFPQPRQPRNGHGMAAYLLGMGPMPPSRPQDVAVAMANRMLDNQAAGLDDDDDDEDENIDPQLRGPQLPQVLAGKANKFRHCNSCSYVLVTSSSSYRSHSNH